MKKVLQVHRIIMYLQIAKPLRSRHYPMAEVYNGTANLQYLSSANLYAPMVSHISPWRCLEFQTRGTSLLQYPDRDRLYAGSERVCAWGPRFRARRIFLCHRREARETANATRVSTNRTNRTRMIRVSCSSTRAFIRARLVRERFSVRALRQGIIDRRL